MSKPQNKSVTDKYHGIGGSYVINDKGERVPATGVEQARAKPTTKSSNEEKQS